MENDKEFDKEKYIEEKKKFRSDMYSKAENQMTKILSSAEDFRNFLDTVSRFDQYSMINLLLINSDCPNARYLKSYNDWNDIGVKITKGEKGIYIFKPSSYSKNGVIKQSINPTCLFDVSQTQNGIVPEKQYDPRNIVKALADASQCEIDITDELAPRTYSTYVPDKNLILIKRGLDVNDVIKNLSKEVAQCIHAKDNPNYNRNDYLMNAFVISYLTCKKFNIDVASYNFDKIVTDISKLPMEKQKECLDTMLKENKNIQRQVDKYLYRKAQEHER